MTYAAVPALRVDDALAKEWTPRLASTSYDFGLRPVADKAGALAGMGMTEKQGGSDVRANVTTATPTAVDGEYTLDGHKWFTSAPMNDVFLVLAQAPGGLTCFLLPRVLPDGSRNRLDVVRLKDKLGNRSNASSELELRGTWAQRLGDEGRGVRTIIEMVAATRLDCVLGSASLMRRALAEASWHVAHRSAFGGLLSDKPLMQNVVADLAVESEAATALGLRLAAAVDAAHDPHEAALRRIALPLAKFWVCKRTPMMVAEALECLGGNGYVEESGLPLLYRESPLNSVWEGSGNVNALDVLRALSREPEALNAWLVEVGRASGEDPRLDRAIEGVLESLADTSALEVGARRLAGQMAACLQGALLVRFAPAAVADAFCATRLGTEYGGTLGTLPRGVDLAAVVTRTTPVVTG
jgi:putative acyl-CoA dehydrogenase